LAASCRRVGISAALAAVSTAQPVVDGGAVLLRCQLVGEATAHG
jgi:hypothetical protein